MWRARKDAAEQKRKQLLYDCKLELHYVLMPLALEGYVCVQRRTSAVL